MENMTTKITSSYNNALDIKVVEGHFATNHSHINRYIDMTTLKSRRKMALAAAKSMATEYVATTIVDTIAWMEQKSSALTWQTLSQRTESCP